MRTGTVSKQKMRSGLQLPIPFQDAFLPSYGMWYDLIDRVASPLWSAA